MGHDGASAPCAPVSGCEVSRVKQSSERIRCKTLDDRFSCLTLCGDGTQFRFRISDIG